MRNPQFFPVDLNTADEKEILRVPGIGVRGARKIIRSRKFAKLRYEDLPILAILGISLKRAKYFILCEGHKFSNLEKQISSIRNQLLGDKSQKIKYFQPELPFIAD